jgi:hypothetical protein
MTSGDHLVLALKAAGFKEVEHSATPLELSSWRGKPIDATAEIVVRRRHIGATADDLGFTRGAEGRYEGIVSEILLGRFDRRWFAELEKRYAELGGVVVPAQVRPAASKPTPGRSEPIEYALPTPAQPAARPKPEGRHTEPPKPSWPSVRIEPPPARSAPMPTLPVDAVEMVDSRATIATSDSSGASLEQDVVAVLSAAKRAGRGGGCVPILLFWAVFSIGALAWRAPLLLLFVTVVAAWGALRSLKLRKERAFAAAAAEFRSRFGSRAEARERALAKLRSEIGRLPSEQRAIVEHLLRRSSW